MGDCRSRCNLRVVCLSSADLPLQLLCCYLWHMCTCSSMAQGEAGIGRALMGGGEGWEVQGCLQWKALVHNLPAHCVDASKMLGLRLICVCADCRTCWSGETVASKMGFDHLKELGWKTTRTKSVQAGSNNIPLYHQQDCLLSSMPHYLHSSSQPCMCLHNPKMGTALSALLTPLSCHGGGGACVAGVDCGSTC